MEIEPFKTKADYRAALKEIEALMTSGRHTPEGEWLDVLVTLVEAYENKHYRFGNSTGLVRPKDRPPAL